MSALAGEQVTAAVLRVTPRQLYEASRLADRCGDAIVQELAAGRLLVLLATHGPEPDLALELDCDGQVVAQQYLALRNREPEDDGLEDMGEEEPIVYLDAYAEGARPAPVCECADPLGHDELCVRCGRTVAAEAFPVARDRIAAPWRSESAV